MVANLIAFLEETRSNRGEFVSLAADQKKRGSSVFSFQDVENLRRPLRIGAIIECDRNLIWTRTIASHAIWFGQRIHDLVRDESGMVQGDRPRAVGRSCFQVQNFAIALHVNILAGRDIAQLGRRSRF